MPPRKQPMSLQDLSLNTLARLTIELCVNIERKHGGWECQASRDELVIGKTYLSSIYHLLDDLLKVVLNPRDPTFIKKVNDKSLILELLICDTLRTVDLSQSYYSYEYRFNSSFWENQFLKLKNVVNLNIVGVLMTDASFRAIGDVCTNVRKLFVTFNPNYASTASLKHILKCGELRELRIVFPHGENDEVQEYVGMLAKCLPKLEHLDAWPNWNMYGALSLTKPWTTMRKLKIDSNYGDITEMIRVFPNLTDLEVLFQMDVFCRVSRHTESLKVVNVLAESSLQLTSLKLIKVALCKELSRVITCKGAHLTSLEIIVGLGNRISVKDVYTIGVSCPGIVKLRLRGAGVWPITVEQTFVSSPPMFVRLKVLELYWIVEWDQRIVPLILRHAVNLTSIKLVNVFISSNTSVDPVSQILNASALQQLERLHIEAQRLNGDYHRIPFPKASIERLLHCCHKLVKLYLMGQMEAETIRYLRAQQSYMKRKNFDFTLDFDPLVIQ